MDVGVFGSNDLIPRYYSLETTFHEYLLRSAHRTTDPAEAWPYTI